MRGARDRLVDAALIAGALVYGGFWMLVLLDDPNTTPGALVVEAVLAVTACASLWWRRRWTLVLAVALLPARTALAVGGVSVGHHRRSSRPSAGSRPVSRCCRRP